MENKNSNGSIKVIIIVVLVCLGINFIGPYITALLATPVEMSEVDEAKKSAFENSAYGLINAINLDYLEDKMDGTVNTKTYTFPNSELNLSSEEPGYGKAIVDEEGKIEFAIADKEKNWCVKKKKNSEEVSIEKFNSNTCVIE